MVIMKQINSQINGEGREHVVDFLPAVGSL